MKDEVTYGGEQAMFSASGRASQYKYFLFTGKSGKKWVVADQLCPGENIWVDGGKGSRGSAGRTLTFELVQGGCVDLIGPWKTGVSAFKEDCGIDLPTHQWMTGIVALERESNGWPKPWTYKGIIRFDQDPILGHPEVYKAIAREESEKRQSPVFWQFQTIGGGCSACAGHQFLNTGADK